MNRELRAIALMLEALRLEIRAKNCADALLARQLADEMAAAAERELQHDESQATTCCREG